MLCLKNEIDNLSQMELFPTPKDTFLVHRVIRAEYDSPHPDECTNTAKIEYLPITRAQI